MRLWLIKKMFSLINSNSVGKHMSLSFYSKVKYIPLSDKPNLLGEDAWFITPIGIGIADGIGGWSMVNIDSGLYSRKLMSNAEQYIMETKSRDPSKILKAAYNSMDEIVGTTTVCILTLHGNILRAANIGDSGFVHFRFIGANWEILCHSREQQHYFNCPKQLGTDSGDMPEHADIYEYEILSGDIIVLATDGIWDNIFDYRIVEILMRNHPINVAKLEEIVWEITDAALKTSIDKTVETPFSLGAQSNRIPYSGGKKDDICCVVSLIN